MEELFKVAKVINVNGSQVYYVNVDTNGAKSLKIVGKIGTKHPNLFCGSVTLAQSRFHAKYINLKIFSQKPP